MPGITKQYEVNLARYRPLGKVASIVAVGLNESKIMPGLSKPIIRLETFSKHVDTICALANEAEVPLIFVGPQPVDETKTIPNKLGVTLENDLISEYAEIILQQAAQHGHSYVDTAHLFSNYNQQAVMDSDGYHPNATGHAILYSAIHAELMQTGIFPSEI